MSVNEPKIEIIDKQATTAVVRTSFSSDKINVDWHTHPEFEILYIIEGFGSRIIGDSVSSFGEGMLMLIGSNVPHLIKSDAKSIKNKQLIFQFSEKLIAKDILYFEEFKSISTLIYNSYYGIDFPIEFSKSLLNKLINLTNIKSEKVVSNLFEILEDLSLCDNYTTVTTLPYKTDNTENTRIGKVYNYVLNNYMQEITVDKAAKLLNLSKPAFCNYFKKKVNKRFTEFVNEIRINKACILLKETDKNISEISYEVGFVNISYFNRYFLKLKNITPLKYRINKSMSL
ncbi:MAG: helix-turn-helix domain-containing protein [Bacteroidales bacterium]|nr:helix-turn-helix domain-containing protein [Bacteroidales bacterium]